jgi:hypothetical protein
LIGRHVLHEDHVGAEQHDSAGQGPSAAVDCVDELVGVACDARGDVVIEQLDEAYGGRQVHGTEVVAVRVIQHLHIV